MTDKSFLMGHKFQTEGYTRCLLFPVMPHDGLAGTQAPQNVA